MDKWIFCCSFKSPDLEDETNVFVGTKDQCNDKFDEALISGEYPFLYMGKITQLAESVYETEEFPEPVSEDL